MYCHLGTKAENHSEHSGTPWKPEVDQVPGCNQYMTVLFLLPSTAIKLNAHAELFWIIMWYPQSLKVSQQQNRKHHTVIMVVNNSFFSGLEELAPYIGFVPSWNWFTNTFFILYPCMYCIFLVT